ncbi:hypothetical protein TNCV_2766861 [Trichonephila clavipes]|nr:hypothetical protein TNCV_2766861 [Trichonephila clavipes]
MHLQSDRGSPDLGKRIKEQLRRGQFAFFREASPGVIDPMHFSAVFSSSLSFNSSCKVLSVAASFLVSSVKIYHAQKRPQVINSFYPVVCGLKIA